MRSFFAVLCLIFLGLGCQNQSASVSDLIDYIPKDSPLIIKTHGISLLESSLKNNDLAKATIHTSFYKKLSEHLSIMGHFAPKGEVLFCFNEVGKQNVEYTMITRYKKNRLQSYGTQFKKVDTIAYDGTMIMKVHVDGHEMPFFTTVVNGVFIASSSRLLAENSIRQRHVSDRGTDEILDKLYRTSDSQKQAIIFMNHNKMKTLSDFFLKAHIGTHVLNFADWTATEITISTDKLAHTGIAMTTSSSPKIMNSFSGTLAQENKTALLTSDKAKGFISFTFDDYMTFRANLETYKEAKQIKNRIENDTVFKRVNEIGLIFDKDDKNMVMHVPAMESLRDLLNDGATVISEFRDIAIYQYRDPEHLKEHFIPLIVKAPTKFYAFVDDFIVFSESVTAVQNMITNYLNKATLGYNSSYVNFIAELNSKSSMLMVGIDPGFKFALQESLQERFWKDTTDVVLRDYPYVAFQAIRDRDFMHTAALMKKTTIKENTAIVQSLSVILDADVAIPPRFVTNHRTKQKELIVQDVGHVLYLISNKGKVLWKKPLDSKIQGNIQQVDLYRNGRLQLAFVTQNTLYIIDRNGNDVAPFPLRFPETVTQPLAVFDYDKNRNYRFLVCMGKKLAMYDGSGKIVSGFTFTKTRNNIWSVPQHYRMGAKDYLVILEEGGSFNILHRTGKLRVPVNERIDFSENTAYAYAGTFMVTDKNGDRIQIDPSGKLKRMALGLEQDHYICATPEVLVTFSDNVLTIQGKRILMDFGFYTRPEIFYIGNMMYVSITDMQANKVYLYDRNGNLLPHFPVYGMSAAMLSDIDNDKKPELTVQGDKNAILLYEMN